jgi:hypothetical protein
MILKTRGLDHRNYRGEMDKYKESKTETGKRTGNLTTGDIISS